MTAVGTGGTGTGASHQPSGASLDGDRQAPDGDGHPPDGVPVEHTAEEIGATEALPRLFKVFGGIVAPTSLLTGLLFYFGRSRASGYYRYFHVNATVLDLSTNDYLFSGVDGLFVPVAVACLLALLVLWGNRLLLTRGASGARRRTVRVLVPLAGVTGAVLVGLAFADLLTEGGVFGTNSATGGLFLVIGVILLVYAVRLLRLFMPAADPAPRVVPRRGSPSGGLPSCS